MTQLCLYLDRDLFKKMENEAKKRDMSLSAFVRIALKEYFESKPAGNAEKLDAIKDGSSEDQAD
jgi:predicted transcriptional regulator